MTEDDEADSIARVVAELRQRFPGVPKPVIDHVVDDHYREFHGAPIRDYVAVMVKRSAKESIAATLRQSRSTFGRSF